MNPADPNIGMLQAIANALGDLTDELVFVGGCAVGLLITEPARPPARATTDVDVIAEVISYNEYCRLGERLKNAGFVENSDHTCRWQLGQLLVDVMPTSEVLGFTNAWYTEAIRQATPRDLPNGKRIRLVSAPLFLATKIEAFHGRGEGDYASSRDIEDIVTVVDGRTELLGEIRGNVPDVIAYLKEEVDELLSTPRFVESIAYHLHPDSASQARATMIIERFRSIAGL